MTASSIAANGFTCVASDLRHALEVAAAVKPRPATAEGGSGFLVKAGATSGHVYSFGSSSVVRCPITVSDASETVELVLPLHAMGLLRTFGRESIRVTCEKIDDGCQVSVAGSGRTSSLKTLAPAIFGHGRIDARLDDCEQGKPISAAILRAALIRARPFLPAATMNVASQFRGAQMFDATNPAYAKGDGTLFASNWTNAFYFHSSAFVGRALQVHAADFNAAIKFTEHTRFIRPVLGREHHLVSDIGSHLLGARCEPHAKFSYYPLRIDGFVFRLPREAVVRALRDAIVQLSPKCVQVRLLFDRCRKTLRVEVDGKGRAWQSHAVPLSAVAMVEPRDLAVHASAYSVVKLIEQTSSPEVEMRIAVVPPDERHPAEAYMIRTIEEFWMDEDGRIGGGADVPQPTPQSHLCRVTRFAPSSAPPATCRSSAGSRDDDASAKGT